MISKLIRSEMKRSPSGWNRDEKVSCGSTVGTIVCDGSGRCNAVAEVEAVSVGAGESDTIGAGGDKGGAITWQAIMIKANKVRSLRMPVIIIFPHRTDPSSTTNRDKSPLIA
jgi:hypothetical protein